MTAPLLMGAAWAIELAFGWPNWLFRRIRHPVVWIGAVLKYLETRLNRVGQSARRTYVSGAVASLTIIIGTTATAAILSYVLPNTTWGYLIEVVVASSLIASRSLHEHVYAVATALKSGDMVQARLAVGRIVGRDPDHLDENGIARASLESLAENASDGVIAPIFWGAVFGLPGIVAYKTINTLDSMIGHRNRTYAQFGGFAARVDDLANLIPARLTALLIASASLTPDSWRIMWRDARKHRSPNAGWPEAAMAGALGIRLSGPRMYGANSHQEPWLNETARSPEPEDLDRGLILYFRALGLGAFGLAIAAAGALYGT